MDLFYGGLVGVVLQELFTKLKELIKKATSWKETFQSIMAKLEKLQPLVEDITKLSRELNQQQLEMTDFETLIMEATKLVDRYPEVSQSMNVLKKSEYTKNLRHLDQSLDLWLNLLQVYQSRDLKEILKLVRQLRVDQSRDLKELQKSVRQVEELVVGLHQNGKMEQSQISSTRCREVPGGPDIIIELDETLNELKAKLLREESSVLVLTALPGCGETTLVQKLCKDRKIEEKFKLNIMFVKVSKTADLKLIVQNLYQHNSRTAPVLRDEEDARNCLEQLLKHIGPSPILLVLDDVWDETVYLIDKFRFQIPEYKILVTSRFIFKGFGLEHELKKLNQEKAVTLFRYHAKLEDGGSKEDLVEETLELPGSVADGEIIMAASVAGNLIGGAASGAEFQLLFTEIQTTIQLARAFKGELENLDKKLKSLEPLVKKMIDAKLDLSLSNTTNFEAEMKKGTLLVAECKSLSSFTKFHKRPGHAEKLRKFGKYLDKLGQILWLQLGVDTLTIVGGVKSIVERLEKQENMAPACMVSDRGGVPQPPQFVIGLVKPLEELKMKILRKDGSVLVLNAHLGCGKTTLAQKLCNDSEIKGKFGSNIMFVEVSKTADLNLIVRCLCEQKGFAVPRDVDDARKSLELLLKEIGPGPILLVLDDVWSESKYIIEKFMFDDIPEYKILVTSRFEFPALGPTFKLETLDNEDAMKLFRFYAKLEDQNSNIPDELVEEVVQHCKRVPLALKLIGRSLCGLPREIWYDELKEWSKWDSSVLHSERELRLCLKRSLDVFDQKDEVLKECFLDLGSFPEQKRIPATALVDMWTELYRRDEADATAYLFKLGEFNLADVKVTRKDMDEEDDYYSEHFVTQHDMLRELAIHLSRQDPQTQRKRLFLELNEKNLCVWWNELNERTFHARLVSITTDGNCSSNWCNMNLPEAEVLILNFQSENYTLPYFLKNMSKLKVLIITNYGSFPTNLSNFELLGSLTNLKRIRFQHVVIPPLSKTSIKLENLQKLSLFMCKVGQAFYSIQRSKPFPKLEELNINYCSDFVALPAEFCDMVKNVLRKLSITHCHKLSTLPKEIGEMDHLEVLRLRSCIDLESLPDSICSLSSLKFLDISDCFSIRNLPEEISNLSRSEKLNMNGCSRLPELLPSVLDFERLKEVVCDEKLEELWESSLPSHRSISLTVAKEDINLNWLENMQS